MLGSVRSSLKSIYTYFSHKQRQNTPQTQFLISRFKKRTLPDHFAQKLLDLEIAVTRDPHNSDLFKTLMELYAQGVEYYSSIGDDRYIALTERMQNFYQNPKIFEALESTASQRISLQGLTSNLNKLEDEEVGTPMGVLHFPFSDLSATTAVQTQLEDLKRIDPSDQTQAQFRFQEQISRLTISSFQEQAQHAQTEEEQKQNPENLMEGAFVDFMAKREKIKIDLERQASVFNQRLMKRRLASASRSRNNSRTHYSQKSCPKKQRQSLCSHELAHISKFNYQEDSLSPRREKKQEEEIKQQEQSREVIRLSSLFPEEMRNIEAIGKIKETEVEQEEEVAQKKRKGSLQVEERELFREKRNLEKPLVFEFEEEEEEEENFNTNIRAKRKSRKSCFTGTESIQQILKKEEGLRRYEFLKKQYIPVRMERKQDLKSKLMKRVPSLKGLLQSSTPKISSIVPHSYNPTPRTSARNDKRSEVVTAKLHRFSQKSGRMSHESGELKGETRKPKHCFISLSQAVKRPK